MKWRILIKDILIFNFLVVCTDATRKSCSAVVKMTWEVSDKISPTVLKVYMRTSTTCSGTIEDIGFTIYHKDEHATPVIVIRERWVIFCLQINLPQVLATHFTFSL